MANLKIKSESKPTRCDICHKSDFFDPLTNSCSRCVDLVIPAINKPQNPAFTLNNSRTYLDRHSLRRTRLFASANYKKTLSIFSLTGLLGGLLFDKIINIEDFETFWFYLDPSSLHHYGGFEFLPTWKYYFFAGLLFQISIWISYEVSSLRKWVNLNLEKQIFHRWLAILLIQVGFFCSQIIFPNSVVAIFLPGSIGIIVAIALKAFASKLATKENLAFVICFGLLSYFLFPMLMWLEETHAIRLYYGGLGAFYSMLFGLGILFANEIQIESQETSREFFRVGGGEVS